MNSYLLKPLQCMQIKFSKAESNSDCGFFNAHKFMLIWFLCLLYMSNAHAQSIVADGDFDTGYAGWHCGVNPEWVSDDGSQISGNGSLLWSRENFISAGGQLGGGHCDWAVVSEGNLYKFEGSLKIPAVSEFENVLIDFYWHTENEIFISVESFIIPTNTLTRDSWLRFERQSAAPSDAKKLSATMAFGFYGTGQTEVSAYVLWDDLKVLELPDQIFEAGFD